MAEVVIDPLQKTAALHQKRLIDFKTGNSKPRDEHVAWLKWLAQVTNTTHEFTCHIYGFASKTGNADVNMNLSYQRASEVAQILEKANPLFTSRIQDFIAKGEEGYSAPEGDNDPLWRAVEVHVFLGSSPVPPKPNVDPKPPIPRTGLSWSVSGVAAFQNNPIGWIPAQIALNLFFFRNDETGEVGWFIAPMCGAGIDVLGAIRTWLASSEAAARALQTWLLKIALKFPGLAAKTAIWAAKLLAGSMGPGDWKELLSATADLLVSGGAVSPNPSDFTKAKVFLPVTMHKLDLADVANASVTLTVKQYGALWVSGKTWYTERSGKRMFGSRDWLEVPASWSTQLQIPNFGANFLGGALIRIK